MLRKLFIPHRNFLVGLLIAGLLLLVVLGAMPHNHALDPEHGSSESGQCLICKAVRGFISADPSPPVLFSESESRSQIIPEFSEKCPLLTAKASCPQRAPPCWVSNTV